MGKTGDKMKKLLVGLVILVLLSGCSSPKESKTVCSTNVDGMTDIMTISAENDKIVAFHEEIVLKWADYDVETEEDKALFQEYMVEAFSSMAESEGITLESSTTEEALIIKIVVNIEEVDYTVLAQLGMVAADSEEISSISLEDSIYSLSNAGYSCTTNE